MNAYKQLKYSFYSDKTKSTVKTSHACFVILSVNWFLPVFATHPTQLITPCAHVHTAIHTKTCTDTLEHQKWTAGPIHNHIPLILFLHL